MSVHQLSRAAARRIAVRAQLLCDPQPTDLLDVVRHLTLLQADPTAAVAPSAELVAWSRLGSAYRFGELATHVADGSLVELQGRLRPAADIALFRAEMAVWPGRGPLLDWQEAQREWILANDDSRREILALLYDEGPLPARALPDSTIVPWRSSGWNNDRNVRMLLSLMVNRGEVAAAGYDGRDRLWDLAERIYPDDPIPPLEDALRIRNERRLHSVGIWRARAAKTPEEPDDIGNIGEPAHVDGVRGTWRLDPAYLNGDRAYLEGDLDGDPDRDDFAGRTILLSPLDRLVYDRKRMADLFEFDYQLEMYKPAARRRWGYWAMPILSGDRLIGKLDATADRNAGVFRVDAIHQDVPFDTTMTRDVHAQIDDLGHWLGLRALRPR